MYDSSKTCTISPRSVAAFAGPGRIKNTKDTLIPGGVPIARPRVDLMDPETIMAGVQHRFGCKRNFPDARLREKFRIFSTTYLRRTFQPVPVGTDVSRIKWLESANYSAGRKKQLAELLTANKTLSGKDFECKSFPKAEGYDDNKHSRGINSYSDKIKATIGGVCSAIDKIIFSHPAFVKNVAVDERPVVLQETFGDRPVFLTDHTSFESQHFGVVLEIFRDFMEYMTMNLAVGPAFMQLFDALTKINICRFKSVSVKILERLMSGAFWTSSSNTLVNLLILLFLYVESVYPHLTAEEQVAHADELPVKVEGDDGLSQKFPLDESLIDKMGLMLKLESYPSFAPASFCGIKTDLSSMQNLTDPRKVYAELGIYDGWWRNASDRLLKEMLRCRGLSILACYPACPIVTELGLYAVRVTAGIDDQRALRHASLYQKEKHLPMWARQITSCEISLSTRTAFAEFYGISVEEQLKFEDAVRQENSLELPWLDMGFNAVWYEYARNYTVPHDTNLDMEFFPVRNAPIKANAKRIATKKNVSVIWPELEDGEIRT